MQHCRGAVLRAARRGQGAEHRGAPEPDVLLPVPVKRLLHGQADLQRAAPLNPTWVLRSMGLLSYCSHIDCNCELAAGKSQAIASAVRSVSGGAGWHQAANEALVHPPRAPCLGQRVLPAALDKQARGGLCAIQHAASTTRMRDPSPPGPQP